MATVAVVALGGIQACSGAPAHQPLPGGLAPGTATVSIEGRDTGTTYTVTCSQIQWSLTIETLETTPGFTALVEKGTDVTAKFVKIRDIGGFTGSYWEGGVGGATASHARQAYSITGTAYGIHTDTPNRPTTRAFKITSAC